LASHLSLRIDRAAPPTSPSKRLRAPADGYTLLFITSANAVNASLYDKLNFNFIRDITTVAGTTRSPLVLEVNSSFPVSTVAEFIAYAKSNPATISLASYGAATTSHLAGELFKMMAGVNMLHVPYRGSAPMVTDLLSGHVQASFDNLASSSLEYIKHGKLRPLAVTSTNRSDRLPDVPALHELLPGFEASAWGGVGVRRGTPDEIVSKLNMEINVALADHKIRARFADLGASVAPGSPADFGRFLIAETEKWGKVIRAANIKPE
jgi:tripartite-type tricarboxylate transporter receptor subunit TctC